MKKIYPVNLWAKIILSVWMSVIIAVANAATIKGHVVDEKAVNMGSVTVVLIMPSDSSRLYGVLTDAQGNFSLIAPTGKYQLSLSFMGYKTMKREIEVARATENLGEFVLQTATQQIGEVVVSAQAIRREADRFIINTANMPLALGKNASELLSICPGVWVQERRGISINGKTGTQVMIDNRLLHETGGELINYLSTLRAEDIQKVEVVPISGADQDADKTGGLIKITLKKQRINGVEGSVSFNYTHAFAHRNNALEPSLNIKYRHNKLSFYSRANYQRGINLSPTTQTIRYITGNNLNTSMLDRRRSQSAGGNLGGFYDISKRQNVGVEVNYRYNLSNNNVYSDQLQTSPSKGDTRGQSFFDTYKPTRHLSVTANYLLKLDTLGSQFELMFDYNNRNGDDWKNYLTMFRGADNRDTLYRSATPTINHIYSAKGDFDLVLSKASKLKVGFKYSNNNMKNSINYDYFKLSEWHIHPELNSQNYYREQIVALYALYSVNFRNNISLSAGLRGEYTYAVPSTSSTFITEKQNYFGLFPTVYVAFPFDKNKDNQLIISYSRKIQRPSFWDLNPWRYPISEFAYVEGNPRLTPSYMQDGSLSYVFKNQYNLTAGVYYTDDAIDQVSFLDPDNPDVIIYRSENTQNRTTFYLNLSLPFQITKWWSLNGNVMGEHSKSTVKNESHSLWSISGNASSTFTLVPQKSFVEISGFYAGPNIYGNIKQTGFYQINLGFKQMFAHNRFILAVYCNDIFSTGNGMTTRTLTAGFKSVTRHTWDYTSFSGSFTYNFKAGKRIKVQEVMSGAAEEKNRL